MADLLRYIQEAVVWQEVPGEISLAFSLTGCRLRCPGCHSAHTWNPNAGDPLTPEHLAQRLDRYQGLITCVLFFGGEWQPEALLELLRLTRARQLETCLYTGEEVVDQRLIAELTYLKTGPWRADLGGLESPSTNQRMTDLRTHQTLNHKFQGAHYAAS